MLTNAAVKAARPRAAAFKLSDERGLHLFVAPNGRKTFRWRFQWAGREQLLTIGAWPEISLDAARARAELARERRDRGEDPRIVGAAALQVHRFDDIGRRWHEHMLPRWTAVHAGDVIASLERDVFPAIGAMPIGAITVPVVLNALRSVEQRGRLETARRVRQRISAIFSFAIAEGLVETDPAAIVGRALMPPAPARHHPAVLEIAEARELLAAAELVDVAPVVKLASRFLALTAVRLAALRGARWSEIEDLDGAAPLWRIPAARMKLAAAKKKDSANDHLVPLSVQAVDVLRAAARGGQDPLSLIFAAGTGGQIGEAAIGALYARAGFAGRHVPHGWRATFSTILNEQRPEDRAQIDRALGHVAGKGVLEEGINRKVEGAYNRSQLLRGRRELFQAWADDLFPPS